MTRRTSKCIFVLACIGVAILVGILIRGIHSRWYYNVYINEYHPEKETSFYRVYGTGFYEPAYADVPDYVEKSKEDTIRYCETYIVVNAPDNATELKREIDKFEGNLKFEEEPLNKSDEYERRYIKESKEMTRDWKPNNAYIGYDIEEFHYAKIIARTFYSKYTGKTVYNIHPKNSNFEETERKQFQE